VDRKMYTKCIKYMLIHYYVTLPELTLPRDTIAYYCKYIYFTCTYSTLR